MVRQALAAAACVRAIESHIMHLSSSFRKSTPPQNRQLIVYYY